MIFFICGLFLFNPFIQKGTIYSVVALATIAAECIMYIFSFFFVFYSVSSFLKTRKREFGILLMLGMTKKQLNKMVFMENMLIGICAIIGGVGAGLFSGKLFLMIGARFLGISSLPFYLSLEALALTIVSFLILFLIISFCTTFLLKENKLIDLFQSVQRPKREPKASVLLSLLSFGLLVVSYTLSATATSETVYILMLPVSIMTIAGTYFFYNQLSIFIIRYLKKKRSLFWRKTNIITLSSLAYHIKDNARMFFMVTIVSTVAFCSVGVFASTNSLFKHFNDDYPAAISYIEKAGSRVAQKHMEKIKLELEEKNLDYQTLTIPIKYVQAKSSLSSKSKHLVPVISFSDYKKAIMMAEFPVSDQPLKENQALVVLTSKQELKSSKEMEDISVTFTSNKMNFETLGYSKHVAIPDYLLIDVEDNYNSGGLIISDRQFKQINTPVKVDHYTGFYMDDFERTSGIAEQISDNGKILYSSNKPYAIAVSGTLIDIQRTLFQTMFFVALLVGTVFFIAAGSFLYFRLYADLEYDRRQYLSLAKMGLTEKELNRIVTRQLKLLFFAPIAIAVIHSVFAFTALQSYFYLSIAGEMAFVLSGFTIVQILYFFFIRHHYLRNIKKVLF
ncbi:FtsX-like permease family protein [Metabacillus arenae]|nr:ABC transporter permease [Metabacillus arenae]